MYLPFLILLLSVADSIFTTVGVHWHVIEEANPMMNHVMEKNIALFFLIKLGLPLMLIGLYVSINQRWIHTLMKGVAGLYIVVNVIHLIWFLPQIM